MKLGIYAEITKVDEEARMVYGYASTQALDSQDETVKREAIEEALPDYMKFANIREMHKASAVGVAESAELDDKGLYLAAKVVDDSAWAKVKAGVYKGFSIGGKSLVKVDGIISKMRLTEISLVDRPANPECVIDLYKADDTEENGEPDPSDEPGKEDTKDEKTAQAEDLKKWLGEEVWDTQRALGALDTIYSLLSKERSEGDSAQTADLSEVVNRLKAFIASEIMEVSESDIIAYFEKNRDIQKAEAEKLVGLLNSATVADSISLLEKAGRRNSSKDQSMIQTMHDHSVSLGASCSSEKSESVDDIAKSDTIAKLESENDILKARVKELEALPKPAGITRMQIINKEDDTDTNKSDDLDKELGRIEKIDNPSLRAQEMIKLTHKVGAIRGAIRS